jgi:hypothetical protein
MDRSEWLCNGIVASAAVLFTGIAGAQSGIVKCESVNYRNADCRVDGGPVALVRQLSSPPGDCIEGRTWGFDASRSSIWVSNGCRAEFRVGLGQSAAGSSIVLYENDNYGGRSYGAANSVSNLNDSGFNDRASSVIVRGGRWQICENAYFGGRCETLGPGEYPSLRAMNLNDRVSSARELGWTPDGGGGWGNGNRPGDSWGGGGNWGSGSRAILYSGTGLTGQTYVVSAAGVSNLNGTGFNDRARSLRVESGYWIFCSDADFQGNCNTYGPGDYPNLPYGQSASISSGRRVSNNYPYRNNPNWSGY